MDDTKSAFVNGAMRKGQVLLPLSAYTRIKVHSLLTYPNECCGLLIGRKIDETTWGVIKAFSARNAHKGQKSDRYEIEPHVILTAITGAKAQGADWIGVYHSHPNVPPIPSLTDSKSAWESLVYLIVSVSNGEVTAARAWRYTGEVADGHVNGFTELDIVVVDDAFIHAGAPAANANPDAQIDLRGEVLPFSIIRAKEELERMQPGKVVSIVFDCERSLKQLPEALEDDGHYVICSRLHGERQWEVIVKRGYKGQRK